uniref:T-cell leukemia/lymphoma protein 1A n=1 Tax=Ursus maritimus TaxID=29073 RepID=A0A452T5L9_URSMA
MTTPSSNLLAPCPLPSMWQLYPGRRYRGSDSSFWRIVYHIEASGEADSLLSREPNVGLDPSTLGS